MVLLRAKVFADTTNKGLSKVPTVAPTIVAYLMVL